MNPESASAPQANPVEPAGADASQLQVPAAPRPLTPRARRRSWLEMPVRVWLILATTILIVTVLFTASRIQEARSDRWLIENGVDVVAKFTSVQGDPFPKRRPRNEAMPATVVFDWQGQPYKLDIPRLEAKTDAPAMVGEPFPIKVDPANPEHWTEETVARPWLQELTVVGFLLPVLALLAVAVLVKRSGVLRTWRDGQLSRAVVVESHQSGSAPLSRVVRFTLVGQPDRRIFSALMPASAGIPDKGEPIDVVYPAGRPDRAVFARLYL